MMCFSCDRRFYIGHPATQIATVRHCPYCGSANVVVDGFNQSSEPEDEQTRPYEEIAREAGLRGSETMTRKQE